MRFAALSLLLGLISPLYAADAPDDETDVPSTNIRKELLSEYKYTATPNGPTQSAPFLNDTSSSQTMTTVPQDPDLVQMAPYTVRETMKMDSLHRDLVAQRIDAREEAVTRKLGIGVHIAPVGSVGFYAVTVFYIPVFVGFGFSF
jgi:hypothetical protein